MRFAKRNGLGARLRPAQVLQLQQHGQGAFQLAVQVGFVARQAVQPVGVEGLGEGLGAYKGAVFKFVVAGRGACRLISVPAPCLFQPTLGPVEAVAEVHTEHDRHAVRISAHLDRLRGPAVTTI